MQFLVKKKSSVPIYFIIGNKRWGTYYLRGVQIQRALHVLGVDARIATTKTLPNIKNSIIVFVKSISYSKLDISKKNGNKIIWDILDGFSFEYFDCVKEFTLDGLIFSTKASLSYLSQVSRYEDTILYHHNDPRIIKRVNRTKQHTCFCCCYIGNTPQKTNNVSHLQYLQSVDIIETDTRHAERAGWIRRIPYYTCHYAVRTDPIRCDTKPLVKVGVAAACNANMIVNRSNAAVELLGHDYPFICGESEQSAKEMVTHACELFGSDIWNHGLKQMHVLREKLSIENSAREYMQFLRKFK
jgi:hypothetical protein